MPNLYKIETTNNVGGQKKVKNVVCERPLSTR